ncbi:head-tail joining protein [Paraburkholderia pallida]|uniref:Uncharacterized protein n=1 Tax=Paraburkholderia pallida TaxID=2547399 RepID=A0A4P7CW17_9BURK|nr:hypothetical protein [Paraburkholderia pallida]QBQ98173.1 hypothetical protein E1956_13975 [Paraburkholderia pallida]
MFDLSVFWPAFKAAGMLERVTVDGTPDEFDAGFNRPDIVLFDRAKVSDNVLEYQTADAPALTTGSVLVIKGMRYRVSDKPVQDRAGFFSQVPVERMR